MTEDLKETVKLHDRLLRGDPANLKDQPGLIMEHARTADILVQTNKTLAEIRNVGIWVFGIILTGFLTAVMALVYKGHP